MRISLIGINRTAEASVRTLCDRGLAEWTVGLPERAETSHLVVLSAEKSFIGAQAAPLIRRGFHVFIASPPSPSLRDAAALLKLAEEAGVEVGLVRSLRFASELEAQLSAGRVSVCQITLGIGEDDRDFFGQIVADACDLAIALTGSGVAQRVDAEVVRDSLRRPLGLAASVRFQSGALFQLFLTIDPETSSGVVTTLGGADEPRLLTARYDPLPDDSVAIAARMRGLSSFVEAVSAGSPPPVSLADGVLAMRLAERIHAAVR